MSTKKTVSIDKDSGKITQINYTEKRSDNKIETRHLNPDTRKYTGKSVHNPGTGKTKYYNRQEAGMGGCCFSTTCIETMGLPDNCLELNVLRDIRDKILMHQPSGRKLIKEYYKLSPEIIQFVYEQDNAKETWELIYQDIKKAVSLVLSNNIEDAFNHYKKMTLRFKEAYST